MKSAREPTLRMIWSKPSHCIAFVFGVGLTPGSPGTAGTLAGVPVFLLMQDLSALTYWMFTAIFLLIGVWTCGRSSRWLGVHDHRGIVWDEVVGFLMTMGAAPAGWLWIALGFGLFRVFDIIKPWPASLVDRKLGGGAGIVLDDVVAGAYGWMAMQIIAAGTV